MKERSLILVSVDGLGQRDLPHLLKLMPKTAELLQHFECRKLDTKPFVSAQPIWAELLTGRPWFQNGCAGYSKPRGSLNRLEVFSEDDLCAPATLLSKTSDIIINIPLLKSDDKGRIWLSDGSTSTNKQVSPVSLLEEEGFSEYQPRPYASAIHALPIPWEALDACLKTERIRMKCAMSLLGSKQWKCFLLRISIFDHLAHLFGMDIYQQTTLRHFDRIRSFLSELDDSFSILLKQKEETDVCLVSCFSHMRGRGRINLNYVLERGKFVALEAPDENTNDSDRERRAAAARALRGKPDEKLSYVFRSAEGRLRAPQTLAASPISGCIFINDKERFSDGVVSREEFQSIQSRVSAHLTAGIVGAFGDRATLCHNPESRAGEQAIPDLIACIQGVEFHDAIDNRRTETHNPRSVHSPEGFVFLPKSMQVDCSVLTPIGLSEILLRKR